MKEVQMLAAWQILAERYHLTTQQIGQFQLYLEQLKAWNQKFNLTAITTDSEIINYHFVDSLALSALLDCSKLAVVADVGSGGGFPGLPLKIMFPDLKLILIEVNGKKVQFLQKLVESLNLTDVTVVQQDWRTFIRGAQYQIDLFCARASLQVEELLRVFKPSSEYQRAQLVYWAAADWQANQQAQVYLVREQAYQVGDRNRKLVLFENVLPVQKGINL
jgi:16S rRNA (guanine(527)-N(7))-methyltransferase RsmG